MASKTHEYLVLAFDNVTDALAAEKQGHYQEVIGLVQEAYKELEKAHVLATKIWERNEIRASRA